MRGRKLTLLLVLIPFLALISCAERAEEGQSGQAMEMAMTVNMEELGASIAATNTQYVEAFISGDAAALAAFYAQDGMRMAPYEETVQGRAAIEAAISEMFMASVNRNLTLKTTDYGASGNLAYAVGTYSVSYEMEGEQVLDEGKYLTLSKLAPDGTWEVYAQIWNSNLPR